MEKRESKFLIYTLWSITIFQVPMIFHGLVGDDQREEKSPSYFNPEECSMVVQYVKDLLEDSKGTARKVKAKEIGIISPYRYTMLQKLSKCEVKA